MDKKSKTATNAGENKIEPSFIPEHHDGARGEWEKECAERRIVKAVQDYYEVMNVSRRDFFAAAALSGLLARNGLFNKNWLESSHYHPLQAAQDAYAAADSMEVERDR